MISTSEQTYDRSFLSVPATPAAVIDAETPQMEQPLAKVIAVARSTLNLRASQ